MKKKAKLKFPDGSKYVGEVKNGKRHGQGTYTWADGGKYVGEYKDGKQHGQGTYTGTDGTIKKGIWENGQLLELKEEMKKEMKFRGLSIEKCFDFICYNECKERNSESFCRQKCSMQ